MKFLGERSLSTHQTQYARKCELPLAKHDLQYQSQKPGSGGCSRGRTSGRRDSWSCSYSFDQTHQSEIVEMLCFLLVWRFAPRVGMIRFRSLPTRWRLPMRNMETLQLPTRSDRDASTCDTSARSNRWTKNLAWLISICSGREKEALRKGKGFNTVKCLEWWNLGLENVLLLSNWTVTCSSLVSRCTTINSWVLCQKVAPDLKTNGEGTVGQPGVRVAMAWSKGYMSNEKHLLPSIIGTIFAHYGTLRLLTNHYDGTGRGFVCSSCVCRECSWMAWKAISDLRSMWGVLQRCTFHDKCGTLHGQGPLPRVTLHHYCICMYLLGNCCMNLEFLGTRILVRAVNQTWLWLSDLYGSFWSIFSISRVPTKTFTFPWHPDLLQELPDSTVSWLVVTWFANVSTVFLVCLV